MGSAIKSLADETGMSIPGVALTSGKWRMQKQIIAAVAATATGDANTALTASTTTYHIIGMMPKAGTLSSVIIRTEAAGVAGATIDLLSVASGTAVTAGTALITQIAGNTPTAATNYKATITEANKTVAAGALIVLKLVTGAAETLKPLFVDVEFQL